MVNIHKNAGQKKAGKKQSDYSDVNIHRNAAIKKEGKTNVGGIEGAASYLGMKALAGAGGILEGALDIGFAAVDLSNGNPAAAKQNFYDQKVSKWEQRQTEKYNPSTAMSFAGDVSSGIGQQTAYMLNWIANPLGTVVAAMGHVGQGISEAANITGDVGAKEIAYGAITGSEDTILDLLMAGGSKAINSATAKVAGKATKNASKGLVKSLLSDFGGEAFQEFVEDYSDTYLQRNMLGDQTAEYDLKRALYSASVGGLSGAAVGGGVYAASTATNISTGKKLKESGRVDEFVKYAKSAQSAMNAAYDQTEKDNKDISGSNKFDTFLKRMSANRKNSKVKEFAEALSESITAYEALTDDQKESSRGLAILGEMRENLKLTESAAAIASLQEQLSEQSDATIQNIVNWINEKSGTKYTVDDFKKDTDGISYSFAASAIAGKVSEEIEINNTNENAENSAQETINNNTEQETTDTKKRFKASENGVRMTASNNQASISRVVSNKNGKLILEVDDQKHYPKIQVNASDFTFANQDEADMYQYAQESGMDPIVAEAMVAAYGSQKDMSGSEFAQAYDRAYQYSKFTTFDKISDEGVSKLSEEVKKEVADLGKMLESDDTKAKAKNINEQKKTSEKLKRKSNVVLPFGIVEANLSEQQKVTVETARVISAALGNKIVCYKPIKRAGMEGTWFIVNGQYVQVNEKAKGFAEVNGTIYVNLDATFDGNNVSLYALAHETVHTIAKVAPEEFGQLKELTFKYLKESGEDVDSLIKEAMDFYEQTGRLKGMTSDQKMDYVTEEVVCDSMQTMFNDGEVLRQIATNHERLFVRIVNTIKKLLNKIKSVMSGVKAYTREGQAIQNMEKSLKELEDRFAAAIMAAGKNYTELDMELFDEGINVNPETDSATLYSVNYMLEGKQKDKVIKNLSNRFNVSKEEAASWIESETSIASMVLNPKYSAYLNYVGDDNEIAIKKNADYPQGTVDFSPICAKRREFTSVMNSTLRNFPNHVFAATDLAKIRTIMSEEGMIIPCGICYVEDRRQLDTIVAQFFIDSIGLYKSGSLMRPDEKKFNARQIKALEMISEDKYKPSVYDLVSLEGLSKLKNEDPIMAAAWIMFNNARGMQSVRLLANDAEYKREILKYSKKQVQNKNDHGGLRIYSFSDFEPFHAIDIVQIINDGAAVSLAMQGYTKVNEYANIVRHTGLKLNRSLIPAGDLGYHMVNGKMVLDWDTTEGIDIHSKYFFDNRNDPDIGNITIGINDNQIRASMVSEFVDQIIPFHTGQSEAVLREKKIGAWQNYKDSQTEKDIETGRTAEHQINIYTEVIQEMEKRGIEINKRSFTDMFIQVAKENRVTPRFQQFLNKSGSGYTYNEGYHKMLVDFKTFDHSKEGKYLPQMPVKPVFNDKMIDSILKEYVDKQKVKDADIAKRMPKVLNRIENEIVKPSEEGRVYSDRDAEYMELSKDPERNESKLSSIVKEVAASKGYDSPDLYHGTRYFGFTKFKTDYIFTSTKRQVSANYAGDNNYAGVRNINKKLRGGNSLGDIIYDAKQVFEIDLREATDADKKSIFDKCQKQAMDMADKRESIVGNVAKNMPEEIYSAIEKIEMVIWDASSEYTYEEIVKDKIYDLSKDIIRSTGLYEENARIVRQYLEDNYKDMSGDEKKALSFYTNYDFSDFVIDMELGIARASMDKDLLITKSGSLKIPSELREAIDETKDIGSYHLYGDVGNNPFEFDADGANFYAIKVKDIGDRLYDTDYIVKWAKNNGYTSVIMNNIYDYGEKATNYVFFDKSSVKSADPVTYDDNGNIIPLSERFNNKNDDIRYSDRTNTYIPDGVKDNGEKVSFVDLILDGKKTYETRNHNRLSRQWIGIAKDGYVYGRVLLGEPVLRDNKSSEYKKSYINGTNYDIEDGESKYFYPILEKEDFRENPQPVKVNGNYGKYSDRIIVGSEFSDRYTYNYFVSKPDMKLTNVDMSKVFNRAETVFEAKKNASNIGTRHNDGSVSVYVNDIGKDVLITTDGLKHGLSRKLDIISPITTNIGSILQNSIEINELIPKKENAKSSYILLGAATDGTNVYIVRSVVNNFSNKVDGIDVLYAVNAKKEMAVLNAPRSTNQSSLSVTTSDISIQILLDSVNRYFPDILPKDVLKHYGYTERPEGELGNSALYSDRDSEGSKLSKEQQEYFKDSAVRDENGNLQVVYHGSDAEFNEFDIERYGEANGHPEKALFFTNEDRVAKQFSSKGKSKAYYLNMRHPFDLNNLSESQIDTLSGMNTRGLPKESIKKSIKEYIAAGNYFALKMYVDYEKVKDLGYDGVIARWWSDQNIKEGSDPNLYEYAVFNSNQAKLVSNDNPTGSNDVRYSDRYDDIAKEYFGTTEDPYKAGYMLRDGSMLDFRNTDNRLELDDYLWEEYGTIDDEFDQKLAEHLDHDMITLAFEDVEDYLDLEDEVSDYIDKGNVRMIFNDPPERKSGFQLSPNVEPTLDQYEMIEKYSDIALSKGQSVFVGYELSRNGKGYEEFGGNSSGRDIVNNIKYFYANGNVRSELNSFRYSDKQINENLNLIAVHGTTEEKLMKALNLEGLPGLSIAIMNSDDGLSNEGYGEISLVFNKSTIDPKRKGNAVYGSDAWTPTTSEAVVEREINGKNVNKFDEFIYDLSKKNAGGIATSRSTLSGIVNRDYTRYDANDVIRILENRDTIKSAYLEDIGINIEPVKKEGKLDNYFTNEELGMILDEFDSEDVLNFELVEIYKRAYNYQLTKEDKEKLRKTFEKVLRVNHSREPYIKMMLDKLTDDYEAQKVLSHAMDFYGNNRRTKSSYDVNATQEKIDEALKGKTKDLREWIEAKINEFNIFTGKEGVYNYKDRYTSSGNTRSFNQTHLTLNAENIVKIMNRGESRGVGYSGINAEGVQSLTSKKYRSIDDIKSDKKRLKTLNYEEYNKIKHDIDNKIVDALEKISKQNGEYYFTEFSDPLMESASGSRTSEAIREVFHKYKFKISDASIKELQEIYNEAAVIPTKYFEAKANRVVGFNEIVAAVVPSESSEALKSGLKEKGIPVKEYDINNQSERLETIKSLDDVKFSDRALDNRYYLVSSIEQNYSLTKQQKDFAERYKSKIDDMNAIMYEEYKAREEKKAAKDRKDAANVKLRDLKEMKTNKDPNFDQKIMDEQTQERARALNAIKKSEDTIQKILGMRLSLDTEIKNMEGMKTARNIIDTVKKQNEKVSADLAAEKELSGRLAANIITNRETMEKEAKQKIQEEKNRLRDRYNKTVEKLEENYKQREYTRKLKDDQKKERFERNELEKKTMKEVNSLVDRLLNPTKEKNIPKEFQKETAEILASINVEDLEKNIKAIQYYDDLINKELDQPEPNVAKIEFLTQAKNNLIEEKQDINEQYKRIANAYQKIIDTADPNMQMQFDDVARAAVEQMRQAIGSKNIHQMTQEELRTVYDAVRIIKHRVIAGQKAKKIKRGENYVDIGEKIVGELRSQKKGKEMTAKVLKDLQKFGIDNLKPLYLFDTIGSNSLSEVFWEVYKSEADWAQMVKEGYEFRKDIAKKYGRDDWDLNKVVDTEFRTLDGTTVKLTLGQIMSIYATYKQEESRNHLRTGGFTFRDTDEVVKKLKGVVPVKYTRNTKDVYRIDEELAAKIAGSLTDQQKGYVDEMQGYLSTVLAAKGNIVSNELYGIDMFTNENYFPIETDSDFRVNKSTQSMGDPMIKYMGITKRRKIGANNPMIVDDFDATWARHLNKMSVYSTMVLPLEDFHNIFEFNTAGTPDHGPTSVKAQINNNFNEHVVKYIQDLETQLNGGARSDPGIGFMNKMTSLFKKGATFMSASVVIQQPTSIFRAMAMIDPKYFVAAPKLSPKQHEEQWEMIKKYAGVAIIKDMGFFDTGNGMRTEDFINQKEYGTFKEKAQAMVKDSAYRDSVLSKAPALADEYTWCQIWMACENEIADKTNLKRGSEEFNKAVADRFYKVIAYTQVYDSVMTKSSLMRSSNSLTKMATAFMAEPQTTLNMYWNAIRHLRAGDKEGFARILGSVLAAILVNSLLVSLIYAARDDDEDKTYTEKYWSEAVDNIGDNVNPLNMIPIVRDFVSIAQGYDVERTDMSIASDLYKSYQVLTSGSKTKYQKFQSVAGSLGNLAGLPVKNVLRDSGAVVNLVKGSISGDKTTAAGMKYAMLSTLFGKSVSNGQQLYDAKMSGDQTMYDRVVKRFASESAANSALRTALRQNDSRIAAAAEAKINGDQATYKQMMNDIVSEGVFDADTVLAATNAEYNSIRSAEKQEQ